MSSSSPAQANGGAKKPNSQSPKRGGAQGGCGCTDGGKPKKSKSRKSKKSKSRK